MPFLKILFIVVFLFSGRAVAAERPLMPAPSPLPHTNSEMQNPDFWISRHPNPDQVILNMSSGIGLLNTYIREDLKLTRNIFKVVEYYSGEELKTALNAEWERSKTQELFVRSGEKADDGFFTAILNNANLKAIPEQVLLDYGFIVHYADQRIFPTEKGLYAKPGDIDFDEIQNSALDTGTAVVILHESADKKWLYALSNLSDGWVKKDLIALASRNKVEEIVRSRSLVVISARAGIYSDPQLSKKINEVRMGARFAVTSTEFSDAVEIVLPVRGKDGRLRTGTGYIRKQDISYFFLPYTPRTIIAQAFKLLNQRYGWGGMYGGQDCSRFLQEVFATVGIELPRNSGAQIKSGHRLLPFNAALSNSDKKKLIVESATGGITVLGLKGHIMLYLGEVNGEPYAIHSVWAYRMPSPDGDETYLINKVVVSDLDLGEGSQKGSWLERIIFLNHIQ